MISEALENTVAKFVQGCSLPVPEGQDTVEYRGENCGDRSDANQNKVIMRMDVTSGQKVSRVPQVFRVARERKPDDQRHEDDSEKHHHQVDSE